MKSMMKLAALSIIASAIGVKADFLAWSLDTDETYNYAKIYYAESAEAAESATALTSYLDNTKEGGGVDQITKAMGNTGRTFFAELPVSTEQSGYEFYVLLYNADNQVTRVSDPIAWDVAKIVAQYSSLNGNTVTGATYTGSVANANNFNIPEPTSGLLFLLGSTALLLRRKRA